MKVLIIGASGGSGRAAMEWALDQGHEVTAFSRKATSIPEESPRFRAIDGDATNAEDVMNAVAGHEAVIVTLGISENPLMVRLFGPSRTPMDVRSAGTRHTIDAMKKHGIKRLVVQTTFGLSDTREQLGWVDGMFFSLILKPQIADTEIQNTAVAESGLEWVLVQPVHLTDDPTGDMPFVSTAAQTGAMTVSRKSVGRVLVRALQEPHFTQKVVAVSGAHS